MKMSFLAPVALACTMVGTQAWAVESSAASSAKAHAKNGLSHDLMLVSNDGYSALRAIHGARIAIFNGDTKLADEMLDKAKKDLDAATKDAHTFCLAAKSADRDDKADEKSTSDKSVSETNRKSTGDKGDKMDMIPIDAEIGIADTFVPSEEKSKHIDKANEHLKSGRSKEAVEELRLGEVDVVFTRVLLPLESTKKRVADAEKLVGEHKYYEANLALKAAESGLVIDAIDLSGTATEAPSASAAKSTKEQSAKK